MCALTAEFKEILYKATGFQQRQKLEVSLIVLTTTERRQI